MKVFPPVIVVGPLRDTAPVPVEKVLVPVMEVSPFIVTVPVTANLSVPMLAPPRDNEVPLAIPRTGVMSVGVLANTTTPVPVSSVMEESRDEEVMEFDLVPYRVPVLGRVTVVPSVVKIDIGLIGEKVIVSPPAKEIELVLNVVESEAVNVLPGDRVSIPVPVVMVLPFKEVVTILVAERVSVVKLRSESSTRSPAVPANTNLVAVNCESVILPPDKVVYMVAPLRDTIPVPVEKVPVPDWVKLLLFCIVTPPFEVNPEVAVMSPEIVGVAVHDVPVTVRLPPRVVSPVPVVRVLVPVIEVAPFRVIAPVPVERVYAPV